MTINTHAEVDETWEKISKFSGIFALGSELEKTLLERRLEFLEADRRQGFKIQINSEVVESGMVSGELGVFKNEGVPKDWLENSKIGWNFDLHALIEIDYRIRWCRSVLADCNLVGEDITIWQIDDFEEFCFYDEDAPKDLRAELKPTSLLDSILSFDPFFHTPVWYAAKILSHHRRIESVWENSEGGIDFELFMSLSREWMYFGETWAEAKSVINTGKKTILGHRQKKTLDEHRQTAFSRRKASVNQRQEIIKELITETKLKRGALEKWLQAKLLERFEITASRRTIRNDLKEIGPN